MNEKQDTLFTIYGAKLSKKGDRVNLNLIKGEGDNKQYATISLKLGETTSKTKATIKDGYAYVKVPMLKVEEKIDDTEIF